MWTLKASNWLNMAIYVILKQQNTQLYTLNKVVNVFCYFVTL
ncbi:protein of unknown function [Moritella yayanosii]|uniref:Uncharacterized protein n=1 Tax=Moritella yayanosii TaxID=69539 RepID=A0A330LMH6_9GAMM|nr:protein of unknown function [Moritella yayanosii]